MFINNYSNTTFQAGKKLVPISDYKGPILKLTKKEQAEIADLLSKRSQLSFDLDNVRKILKKNTKTITREWQHLSNVDFSLQSEIERIDRIIKEIKLNRLNIQKAKLAKLDKKV